MRLFTALALASIAWSAACVHDRARVSGQGGAGGTGGAASSSSSGTSVTGGGGDGGTGGSGGGMVVGCGDGALDSATEQCDDGNQLPQDGCDADCNVECPAGWLDVTNHCYRLLSSTATWADARSGCMSLGSGYDLAALSSDAEEQFIEAQLGAMTTVRAWIGGNDQMTEGNFVWANGEAWGFTKWAALEPNDSGGNEDCAELRYQASVPEWNWNDLPCDSVVVTAYLCELTPAGSSP